MNTPASVNTRIKVRLIGFSRMGLFYLNKVLKARRIPKTPKDLDTYYAYNKKDRQTL